MSGLHKFNLKKFAFSLLLASFCIAITLQGAAHSATGLEIYSTLTSDTIPLRNILRNPRDTSGRDTVPVRRDTLGRPADSSAAVFRNRDTTMRVVDTFTLRTSPDALDAPVNYEAADSAVLLLREKKFLLYGNTKTTYKDAVLTAPRVVIDNQTSIVTAYNSRDSLGNIIARARMQQGTENFQSDTITYNFKTQRGLTRNTYTKSGEMWVQAPTIKKVDSVTVFAKEVLMTTCNYDHPHFGFKANKGKFITNKVAITGPIHPEFEGVPIPLYLPFGIFPLNFGRHDGILPPRFTANEQLGLGLEGLGYYYVFNDYLDVTLRTNIYSYGAWTVNLTPTYRKRYRYNGSLNISYQYTKFNFKGDPDYQLSKTFNISWNHTMDQRARPGVNFSANVNAGSTKFNQFIPDNPMRNVQNMQNSSISYSKTWRDKPFNLTLSANQNQNSVNNLMNITLPDAGFTVTTLYPFQRKEIVGAPKWYEKLGVGYSGTFRNQIAFYDTAANVLQRILDTLQYGAQHRFPLNVSLPPLGPLIVSPSISYEETWLSNRILRRWNDVTKKIDTISRDRGIFTDRQLSFSIGMNTTLYGRMEFGKGKIKAIRHVVRPTLSFSYRPNLSKNKYDVIQVDTTGRKVPLSHYENNLIYRGYGYGRFGGLTFGIDNNLEMKVRKDSADKVIRLIDGFGLTSGYNFLQDSLKLQPFNLYLRSTLFEKVSLTAQALLDPYAVDSFGRNVNRFVWQGDRFTVGRLTSGSISMSTQFASKPRDPSQAPNPLATSRITDPALLGDQQRLLEYMNRNPADFVDFNIPWSINLSFSLNFNKVFLVESQTFRTNLSSSFSFNNSFSLTPKWNFSTNGFYDFNTMQLTQFSMQISRDMHCWQMSIGVTPIGNYKYFNITISPKSTLLQDLKVNRTRYFYNY